MPEDGIDDTLRVPVPEFDSSGDVTGVELEDVGESEQDEPFDPQKIDVVTRNPTLNRAGAVLGAASPPGPGL